MKIYRRQSVPFITLLTYQLVSQLVGALSPVSHKGLHQGSKQTLIHLLPVSHISHETAKFFKIHKISLDTNKKQNIQTLLRTQTCQRFPLVAAGVDPQAKMSSANTQDIHPHGKKGFLVEYVADVQMTADWFITSSDRVPLPSVMNLIGFNVSWVLTGTPVGR